MGAITLHGNPSDGHTLKDALAQVERIAGNLTHVFVDTGYHGRRYTGDAQVHVDSDTAGRWYEVCGVGMKRRAAIGPGIGHLKREHQMNRNYLKGTYGYQMNAILSAAGMNPATTGLQLFTVALLRRFFL